MWKYITLHIRRIKTIATEVFKFVHDLNPTVMKEMFNTNETLYDLRDKYIMNLLTFNKKNTWEKCVLFYAKSVNNIQIWTCDEGNMEFYGSEATLLTKAKPRSILLLKIHKTHIVRHHRSIFPNIICQMFIIQAHWSMDLCRTIACFHMISGGDHPCAHYFLWILALCALLLCSMIHYDITMAHDVGSDAPLWHNNG